MTAFCASVPAPIESANLHCSFVRCCSRRRLAQWVATVTSSGFYFLAQFARTLRRDPGAVELAIETPWNNGPIEGQINRLKVIKRQMYGRAGFELLNARALPLSI